jgi:hypothetical protein
MESRRTCTGHWSDIIDWLNDDITAALVEHVRSSIMYERQLLKDLEALRPDISSAADKVVCLTPTEFPNRPLFCHWRNLPFPSRPHHLREEHSQFATAYNT